MQGYKLYYKSDRPLLDLAEFGFLRVFSGNGSHITFMLQGDEITNDIEAEMSVAAYCGGTRSDNEDIVDVYRFGQPFCEVKMVPKGYMPYLYRNEQMWRPVAAVATRYVHAFPRQLVTAPSVCLVSPLGEVQLFIKEGEVEVRQVWKHIFAGKGVLVRL